MMGTMYSMLTGVLTMGKGSAECLFLLVSFYCIHELEEPKGDRSTYGQSEVMSMLNNHTASSSSCSDIL